MSGGGRYFANPYPEYSEDSSRASSLPAADATARVAHILAQLDNARRAIDADPDGALYVGPAGVAFALWRLAQFPALFSDESRSSLLQRADARLQVNLRHAEKRRSRDGGRRVGLLLGHSGVHLVDAALAKSLGDENRMKQALARFNEISSIANDVGTCKPDEFLAGRAGFVFGALWLNRNVASNAVPEADIAAICDKMVSQGQAYSRHARSPSPLMYEYYNTEYLGAGHGLASILQALLSMPPSYLSARPEAATAVRSSLDYLLGLQTPEGNFPCAMDEVDRPRRTKDELVHWCHGAPGTIYVMARAYLVYKDEKYLKSALLCGDLIWRRGLLRKGPGICHGVAGNGYAFLLLHRITGEKKHLYRARCFADFMQSREFATGARTPDCPYSLYEGVSGTALFLADLSKPEEAAFPFMDVVNP